MSGAHAHDAVHGIQRSGAFLECFCNNLLDINIDLRYYGTHSFRHGGCQWLAVVRRWSFRRICDWVGTMGSRHLEFRHDRRGNTLIHLVSGVFRKSWKITRNKTSKAHGEFTQNWVNLHTYGVAEGDRPGLTRSVSHRAQGSQSTHLCPSPPCKSGRPCPHPLPTA